MKLYEITSEMNKIEELYHVVYDEETGEINPDKFELLQEKEAEIRDALMRKSDGFVKVIRNLDSDIDELDAEIKRLNNKKKQLEKKKEWLKSYILMNMNAMGIDKLESTLGKFSISKSQSTEIDEAIIPKDSRYWTVKVEDKFDKKVIKELLKQGEKIKGAMIQENVSLRLK